MKTSFERKWSAMKGSPIDRRRMRPYLPRGGDKMGPRARVHPARLVTAAGLFFALLAAQTATAAPGGGKRPGTRRTVRVLVTDDPALRKDEAWKVDIWRAVNEASLALEDVSGLSLRIKAFAYWEFSHQETTKTGDRRPAAALRALDSLNRHVKEAGRGPGELVIGLVPEGPEGAWWTCRRLSHGHRSDRVSEVEGRPASPVLLHEILHIFGAIDLGTPGSVMSRKDPGFRIDGFTKAIVRINREQDLSRRRVPAGCRPHRAGHRSLRVAPVSRSRRERAHRLFERA